MEQDKEKKEKSKCLFIKLFSKRNRLIFLLSLLGFMIIITVVPGGKEFTRNALWSILPTEADIVYLPSDPYEMGKTHGEEFKYSVQILCTIYIEKLICKNDEKLISEYCDDAEKMFEGIDSRWNNEISGLSEASGVDKRILKLGNTFLDLGLYKAGCRQVTAFDNKTKRLMHAHNMDWDNLGGVGNLMVTVFRTKAGEGRLATVHIAFPGMTGALTVINEKGISLGFNQTGVSNGDCQGLPVFLKLRDIAENCSTFEEAEKEVSEMPKGMPFSIMVSDAKSLRTAVFERGRDNVIRKREPSYGIITSDNISWCGTDMKTCTVNNLSHEEGIFKIDKPGKPLEKLQNVLRNDKVLLGCNIYSVIFDYKNNSFYLASGNIPAASGEYMKHKLFEDILRK